MSASYQLPSAMPTSLPYPLAPRTPGAELPGPGGHDDGRARMCPATRASPSVRRVAEPLLGWAPVGEVTAVRDPAEQPGGREHDEQDQQEQFHNGGTPWRFDQDRRCAPDHSPTTI